MNLLTSNVDLDSIHIKSAPFDSTDHPAEIETLAHTIVELQGLLKIPVVRKLGIDNYELVAGYLEYYAFLEARKIDDQLPDQLTVFILKPNNEKAIFKQLEASQAIQQSTTSSNNSPQSDSTLTLKVSNLESRSEQTAKQISAEIAQLKTEMLSAIDTKLPQTLPRLSPLEAFNRIDDPVIQKQVLRNLAILGSKANKIVNQLQAYKAKPENEEFQQLGDVLKVLEKKTSSADAMLKALSHWDS